MTTTTTLTTAQVAAVVAALQKQAAEDQKVLGAPWPWAAETKAEFEAQLAATQAALAAFGAAQAPAVVAV